MCMKASEKDKIACGDCGLSYRTFIRTANDTFSRRPASRYTLLYVYTHVMGLNFNAVMVQVFEFYSGHSILTCELKKILISLA